MVKYLALVIECFIIYDGTFVILSSTSVLVSRKNQVYCR